MAWLQYPKDITVSTPLGDVKVAVTDAGHAHVSTDAHVNDHRPTIKFRGDDYLISLHLHASRGWNVDPDGFTSVKRRGNWSDAPRTYRQAIIDAISSAVGAYLSAPEQAGILAQAEYADANNDAERLESEASEVATKLADIRKRARAERKRQELARQAYARIPDPGPTALTF